MNCSADVIFFLFLSSLPLERIEILAIGKYRIAFFPRYPKRFRNLPDDILHVASRIHYLAD